MYVFLGYMTLI